MNHIIDHMSCLPKEMFPSGDTVNLAIDGSPVRVARFSHFDDPCYLVHVSAETGAHHFELSIRRHYQDWFLAPGRLGIDVKHERRKFIFETMSDQNLVFWSDGIGYLMISIDPLLDTPKGPDVLYAADEGLHSDPERVQTDALQRILDLAGSHSGARVIVVAPGIYRTGSVHLRSNTTLWLESGALIKASDDPNDMGDPQLSGWDNRRACFINADGAENIAIRGQGMIDGNRHILTPGGYYKSLMKLTICQNVLVEGVTLTDSCGWNTVFFHCSNVIARRVKVINNRPRVNCINTDGINPDCSSHVKIERCMMHTGDDAVAVKSSSAGGQGSRSSPLEPPSDVADIEVTDLVSISNSATCKVGTETTAAEMRTIHFRRIDAVRCARAMVIEAFDRSHIRDVSFEDVHIDAFTTVGPPARLIELSAPDAGTAFRSIGGMAMISDVTIAGVESVMDAPCLLTGRKDEVSITGVRIGGVRAAGKALVSDSNFGISGGVEGLLIGE